MYIGQKSRCVSHAATMTVHREYVGVQVYSPPNPGVLGHCLGLTFCKRYKNDRKMSTPSSKMGYK